MAARVGLSPELTLGLRLRLMESLKITGTSPIIGLLVIFMFFQVLVCMGSIEYRNAPECNKPFNCGVVQDLRYPFRQRGSPAYCGEPGYEMYCQGGSSPMIIISSRSYQVLVYNTTLRSLTLAPMSTSDTVLCPRRLVNTSLNLRPFHAAWNTQNISLYYGCPSDANQYEGLSNHQFNCSMNGTDTLGYFVVTSLFSNLSVAAKDALRSCRSNVLIPAFASILQVLEHNTANLNVTLENGFGVQWDQNDPVSGSSEGFNSKFKLAISLGVAGVSVLLIAVMVVTYQINKEALSRGVLLKLQRGKRRQWERIEAYILQYGSELAPKRYTYAEIKKITKSFKDELDKPEELEVKTLYEIAIGIARGLEYLHQGCNTRILHFDIKPHNILLDDNFCPKISDFGLAKLCERKESIISTISARGTIGYIAPEVFCRSFGGVSHKSDVYSYGMMVLEMVGEKENIHSQINNPNFPTWIFDRLKEGADLNLEGMTAENEELIRKMIIVSLWCIQSNPSDRPSITQAIEMLQGSIESLSIPPTPFLFSPPKSPENTTSSFFTPSDIQMEYSGYGLSSSDSVPVFSSKTT
ncbi:hypothetical protein GQ457_08G014560 [Hibiscus cannabinus]